MCVLGENGWVFGEKMLKTQLFCYVVCSFFLRWKTGLGFGTVFFFDKIEKSRCFGERYVQDIEFVLNKLLKRREFPLKIEKTPAVSLKSTAILYSLALVSRQEPIVRAYGTGASRAFRIHAERGSVRAGS